MAEPGRAKKSLGQYFLTDPETARAVIRAARINHSTPVVEIGPGRGFLTRYLLANAASVLAIEKDSHLAAQLPTLLPSSKLTVIEADFLSLDLENTIPTGKPTPPVLVGNLPYNAAMPILVSALERSHLWARMVLMFQLEVAQRICAKPGSRTFGVPTVLAALTHNARIVRRVPAGAFHPRPKVNSALVLLEPLATPLLPPDLRRPFMDFVGVTFRYRRKTAPNALSKASCLPASVFSRFLVSRGLSPNFRLEQLPIPVLISLWRVVCEQGRSGL